MRCSGMDMPTSRNRSTVIARASRRLIVRPYRWLPCSMIASTICSPTVCTGLNAAIGSCGMSAMSAPRNARIIGPRGGSSRQVDRLICALTIEYLAAGDPPGRLDQLQDRLHRHALAATALTDDPNHLAGKYVEAHAIHGANHAFVELERNAQITDPKQRRDRIAVAAVGHRRRPMNRGLHRHSFIAGRRHRAVQSDSTLTAPPRSQLSASAARPPTATHAPAAPPPLHPAPPDSLSGYPPPAPARPPDASEPPRRSRAPSRR